MLNDLSTGLPTYKWDREYSGSDDRSIFLNPLRDLLHAFSKIGAGYGGYFQIALPPISVMFVLHAVVIDFTTLSGIDT